MLPFIKKKTATVSIIKIACPFIHHLKDCVYVSILEVNLNLTPKLYLNIFWPTRKMFSGLLI
jgi:hypothetical protein